jgi:hypothetical protein
MTSNNLFFRAVGSNLARDFGFFQMKKAIQLAYGTVVVLLKFPNTPGIMHHRAPGGLPLPVKLESGHMTFKLIV